GSSYATERQQAPKDASRRRGTLAATREECSLLFSLRSVIHRYLRRSLFQHKKTTLAAIQSTDTKKAKEIIIRQKADTQSMIFDPYVCMTLRPRINLRPTKDS